MITSIIFTIIVIIASILCDLYIENESRITCKSCDSTNHFMLCCFIVITPFLKYKTFVIVIQMMKFI